ncbi:MAG: tol-pal system-associated acyl-CoA thioesterase [Gammaproteobacteria bacterium]|nr:tol-pal system-associated acyl-CoA thioesterase [Gammaproteobacteria bacterium]MDH3373706.1 tol-pal system-associated acyl-CoA thioesterase [Gammaproteobacteria bacterium]MDH3408991.1 tol-pal system-associated acyl-CoA thioesterase [Gammaproteobacteria bacterium]MDH3553867.1 tol-pal system-associated acyl-CoA thioesterase [Gammaproteobacteria bacterium]
MSGKESARPFEWPVRVYYEDTDAQGVVYYANYFRFMERARTEWLRALGVDQVALMETERRIFVVTETNAEFIVPARFNDQIIVTARLAGLARATFDIEQNIYLDSLDGTLLLRGSVRAAYLNADTMRPTRVPASIFEEAKS